jgi:hypothetical protein
MPDDPRVLIPFEYSLFFNLSTVAAIGLLIVALTTLWRRRSRLPASAFIVWLVVILAVPLLGATAWLVFGRRQVVDEFSSALQDEDAEGSRR